MAKKKEEKQGMDAVIAALEKKHGLEKPNLDKVNIISTGSLQLNQAMGIGGTMLGKIIEIFGAESSGKSTTTLHQMAEYQKAFPEKKVALFDYENSFDKKYATSVGVDADSLLIYQPTDLESGYDMILSLIENNVVSLVVIDSQSAAMPKAVLQGEMGDATIGLQARLNSKFCMKIKGLLPIHNCTLIFISQTRSNIGGMGDPTTTTGGNAIKFYADVRWKIWKSNDKINELNKTTIDIIKNKLAAPFGKAELNILWGYGFDKLGEIIDYAVEFDFIKKGGAWFTIGEEKFQGMDRLKDYLEENYEVLLDLETRVVNKLKGIETPVEEVEVVNEEILNEEILNIEENGN